jgi:cell division protein FtsB
MTKHSNPNNTGVHVYLNDSARREQIVGNENSSPHERYIILMNDTLTGENRKLSKQVMDLESQVEDLESEVESLEKGKVMLKGLLQNFHQMNKWNIAITKTYQDVLNKTKTVHFNYKKKSRKHLNYLEALMMLWVAIAYEFFTPSWGVMLSIVSSVMIVVAYQESTYLNLIWEEHKTDIDLIKETQKEMSKLETAQDYIHEFIDLH